VRAPILAARPFPHAVHAAPSAVAPERRCLHAPFQQPVRAPFPPAARAAPSAGCASFPPAARAVPSAVAPQPRCLHAPIMQGGCRALEHA
jgi:hypothetical protein